MKRNQNPIADHCLATGDFEDFNNDAIKLSAIFKLWSFGIRTSDRTFKFVDLSKRGFLIKKITSRLHLSIENAGAHRPLSN